MRYLIEYFRQFKRLVGNRIYLLLLLILIAGVAEGFGVAVFLPILQDGFGNDRLSRLLRYIFGLFGIKYSFGVMLLFFVIFCGILRTTFLIWYAGYFGKITTRLVMELRQSIVKRIFSADYLYLLKKEIGYINNIIVREVACVIDSFVTFSSILKFAILGTVYLILALLLNYKAILAVLAFGGIVAVLFRRLNKLINQSSIDLSRSYGNFHTILIQALSKLKYLKSTFSHAKISKIIDRENRVLGRSRFKLFFLQSVSTNLLEPLVVLIVCSLLVYYILFLKRGVNEVMFLIVVFMQVARQFITAQTSYRKFLAGRGSIETFKNIEKELSENRESLNLNGQNPDFEKDIKFKDVSLIFPNGRKGLNRVNIRIRPKSVVAFVGFSGSGKSTIANIVTGLLRPTSGTVFLGEVSYDRLNLKKLRKKIGYVTQEDIIFNATIRDNISLWGDSLSSKRLREVIEIANIDDFVNSLPEKEETLLGDNGLDISGGQRQRITIARELYKDAELLILDEATSSLDSKAEKLIYENLRRFKGKKTMIVISHRLSTIKNADYIYVLDKGEVVEEGTYDKLIAKKGEFRKMIEDQKLTETEGVRL